MMTSAQVVETSDATTDNSPSQDYTLPDDQTTLLERENPNNIPVAVHYIKFADSQHRRQGNRKGG